MSDKYNERKLKWSWEYWGNILKRVHILRFI